MRPLVAQLDGRGSDFEGLAVWLKPSNRVLGIFAVEENYLLHSCRVCLVAGEGIIIPTKRQVPHFCIKHQTYHAPMETEGIFSELSPKHEASASIPRFCWELGALGVLMLKLLGCSGYWILNPKP